MHVKRFYEIVFLFSLFHSYCTKHPWRLFRHNPGTKSIFNVNTDQTIEDEKADGDESDGEEKSQKQTPSSENTTAALAMQGDKTADNETGVRQNKKKSSDLHKTNSFMKAKKWKITLERRKKGSGKKISKKEKPRAVGAKRINFKLLEQTKRLLVGDEGALVNIQTNCRKSKSFHGKSTKESISKLGISPDLIQSKASLQRQGKQRFQKASLKLNDHVKGHDFSKTSEADRKQMNKHTRGSSILKPQNYHIDASTGDIVERINTDREEELFWERDFDNDDGEGSQSTSASDDDEAFQRSHFSISSVEDSRYSSSNSECEEEMYSTPNKVTQKLNDGIKNCLIIRQSPRIHERKINATKSTTNRSDQDRSLSAKQPPCNTGDKWNTGLTISRNNMYKSGAKQNIQDAKTHISTADRSGFMDYKTRVTRSSTQTSFYTNKRWNQKKSMVAETKQVNEMEESKMMREITQQLRVIGHRNELKASVMTMGDKQEEDALNTSFCSDGSLSELSQPDDCLLTPSGDDNSCNDTDTDEELQLGLQLSFLNHKSLIMNQAMTMKPGRTSSNLAGRTSSNMMLYKDTEKCDLMITNSQVYSKFVLDQDDYYRSSTSSIPNMSSGHTEQDLFSARNSFIFTELLQATQLHKSESLPAKLDLYHGANYQIDDECLSFEDAGDMKPMSSALDDVMTEERTTMYQSTSGLR